MDPIIQISGLSKTYESGFQALKQLDLTIYRGEILALLGPNGAGKTTLFNMVAGALKPSAGTVTLNGQDVTGQPPEALFARGMAAPSKSRGPSGACRCWKTC